MRSIVLSGIICAASLVMGTSASQATEVATINILAPAGDKKGVNEFKEAIAFHQRNVSVLWEQYTLAESRIKDSRGNHAELDRDKAFFVGVYQQDIDQGLRVEESKKAIAEIEATYAKKHAKRDSEENKQLATLQNQLKAELNREKKRLEKTKKAYASALNDETIPLWRELEHFVGKAIERANSFEVSKSTIAAR